MASVEEAKQTMAMNLAEKTGRSLEEWVAITRQTGLAKHGEFMKYLKGEHSLSHGYANFIALESLAAAEPEDQQALDLVTKQYAGDKLALRPIYEAILEKINSFGDDIEISPKKAYVSIRRKKQFCIIQPSTSRRLDIGINLKNISPTDRLEPSGSFNAMVSHRVRMHSISDLDDELLGWLKLAYEEA